MCVRNLVDNRSLIQVILVNVYMCAFAFMHHYACTILYCTASLPYSKDVHMYAYKILNYEGKSYQSVIKVS